MKAYHILPVLVFCLICLGLVTLSSATRTFPHGEFLKQCAWLLLAVPAGVVSAYVDWKSFKPYAFIFGGSVLVLLVLTLVPGLGIKVNGSRRWLNLGFAHCQVSEFAKLALIFVLARYCAEHQHKLKTFTYGFLIPGLMVGATSALILLEPDFGTAFLCGLVGFILLFWVGVSLKYWAPAILGALVLFSVGISLDPVRLKRITAFMDLEANKLGGAYQLWQGILGFAAGGWRGMGVGSGRQQLHFLPEAHTDFIFPVVGEELGFVATSGIVFGFLTLFGVGIYYLRKIPNMYAFVLGAGSLLLITLQALINMGVVTGLLPTKGMSLPFISYGGSNLVLMCICVGILFNCIRESEKIR